MNLCLYSNAHNSAGERVRAALALKGIEYQYVSIKQIGWDAYRAINPQGILPTLDVDGALLTQSTAILEFIEETFPTPPLLPANPVIRAQARAFGQAITSEMHAIDVGRVRRFLEDELQVGQANLPRWSDQWMHSGFSALEGLLERREKPWLYCYGNEPGWADLFLIPQVRKSVTRFDLEISRYPLIADIYRHGSRLSAFVAAAPEQQPDFAGDLGKAWRPETLGPAQGSG